MAPSIWDDDARRPRHPADAARPHSRRGGSMIGSRLRPPPHDPLQVYGLPSKGETRLNDHKTQEAFYAKIVERYLKFCAASNGGADLDRRFASFSLSSSKWATPQTVSAKDQGDARRPTPKEDSLGGSMLRKPPPTSNVDSSPELQVIHTAMRKLREALVATRRRDAFAQRAEVFIIRAAILTKTWESYHPALLHLLATLHPHLPLPAPELDEFAVYHVLDLACRQADLATAYKAKLAYSVADRKVDLVLKSLVRRDWSLFWKVQKRVDGYQRALLSHAEDRIRLHALKCLGKTYFTADKAFVERCAGSEWADLVRSGVGWELRDDDTVVIRRPKGQ